jgi:hypothetical protein
VVDGVEADREVVILMILRLRILGHIQARDMVMERMRVGDLVSGLEQWEVLLLDTWLGTE